MKKYIKISEAAYNEYHNLRRYNCIASDDFSRIRQKALNLSVLSDSLHFSDSIKNKEDIVCLIFDCIDDLYESLLEYEKNANFNYSLIPKNEIEF